MGDSRPVPMSSAWCCFCTSVKKTADESVRWRVLASGVNATLSVGPWVVHTPSWTFSIMGLPFISTMSDQRLTAPTHVG